MLGVHERNPTSAALFVISLVAAPALAAIAGVQGLAGVMLLAAVTPLIAVVIQGITRAREWRPHRLHMAT